MIPGTYNIELTENAGFSQTFVISGITTAVGYSAAVDIRTGEKPTDTAVLQLTSTPSAGIAISSDGTNLSVVLTLTEAQIDALAEARGKTTGIWSLKITPPVGEAQQYLKGQVSMVRTPTE